MFGILFLCNIKIIAMSSSSFTSHSLSEEESLNKLIYNTFFFVTNYYYIVTTNFRIKELKKRRNLPLILFS
jgi:hypothetical protein